MKFPRFSLGVGDRFAHQGIAQLNAFKMARDLGITISPVWNKSFREHSIVHSEPESVRMEAEAAVKSLAWTGPFFVDADHINLKTVDGFIHSSDFFTLDVADFIGKSTNQTDIDAFVAKHGHFAGSLTIPGIAVPFTVTLEDISQVARKYLFAVREAGLIYRHIEKTKGKDMFITEVSMDETDAPQTPLELFFILAGLADEGIPVRTVAPKFTGRFNKGVDFVGKSDFFEKEFDEDVCVIAFAVHTFGLPGDLKLSVHSGSDKFSIYEPIRRVLTKHGCGLHLKTAGTTWLEEVTGLAEAGGEGLEVAKEIYLKALRRYDELAAPYASVIDIKIDALPSAETVTAWTSAQYVSALDHDQSNPAYNASFRQLIHVGYKVASEMGERYTHALKKNAALIGARVTRNIFEKHILKIFPKDEPKGTA